jgi:hypothetical protein
MRETFKEIFAWNGWTPLAAIGALLAAVATILYTRYTYQILSATRSSIDRQNRVHEFEIFSKLSAELETPEVSRLHHACKRNTLKIDLPLADALTSPYRGETATTDSGLRQHLLNPLEKMAKFWNDGLISIGTIDNTLGYFILDIGNCTGVINHINHLRNNVYNNESLYDGFEKLYKAIYMRLSAVEQAKYKPGFDGIVSTPGS